MAKNELIYKAEYEEIKVEELPDNRFQDITGLIRTISTVPDWTPKKFSDQFIIYISGATYRFYIYDVTNNTWRYATLT